LKIKATALGIQKIDVNEKGGYILFHEKPNVDPLKIIELIQTQYAHYRLAGQHKLKLIKALPNCETRYQFINSLLNFFDN